MMKRPILVVVLMTAVLLWPLMLSARVDIGATPQFSVTTLDGEELESEMLRGKVVLVDFWATWCNPCIESFPFYSDLATEHADDLVIIAVSLDPDKDIILEFLRDREVAFDVVWQKAFTAARQFGPQTFPTSYLIDRRGVVRYVHLGFDDETREETEAQIEELIRER